MSHPFEARTRALRWVAGLALAMAAFAPLLASLGARMGGDLAVVLSAALAVCLAIVLGRSRDMPHSVGNVATGALVLSCVTMFFGVSPTGGGPHAGVWFVLSLLRTAALMPLALTLHRRAEYSACDATDRLALAVSAACFGALVETTLSITAARALHLGYTGMAAPAIGPVLLGQLLLAMLGAFVAMVRSARWVLHWRRLLGSAGVRVEPRARWSGEVPARPWMHLALTDDDAVLVRRTVQEAGAYRAGDVEEALTVMPTDPARVMRALRLRLAAAVVLLGATAGFAAPRLGALRW